jgi:hypothetical protein
VVRGEYALERADLEDRLGELQAGNRSRRWKIAGLSLFIGLCCILGVVLSQSWALGALWPAWYVNVLRRRSKKAASVISRLESRLSSLVPPSGDRD